MGYPSLVFIFFFFLLLCPKRSSKAGIWDSPTSRFLLAKVLLTAKTKCENGNSSSSPGVICHAASEISQAVTDSKVTTEGFQAQHGARLCRNLFPNSF